MDIPILYEDEDILAIDKPARLMVHSDGKSGEETVVDWVLKKYPNAPSAGEPLIVLGKEIARPGIVHRLDKETSGVLLIAKTPEALKYLKRQFQSHLVEKIYSLFVYGDLKRDDGMIRIPLGRDKSDFRKWSPEESARGILREAVTYYQVLKRTPEVSFVEARPKTGRTHQIRVHFKAIGHPLVSDSLYASGKPRLLGFNRLALHARSISFKNRLGKTISVEAPYPEDFIEAIQRIGYSVAK